MAFHKLPFVFNNIVALMCSLLFLNDLVKAPQQPLLAGLGASPAWEGDVLPCIPTARTALSLDRAVIFVPSPAIRI